MKYHQRTVTSSIGDRLYLNCEKATVPQILVHLSCRLDSLVEENGAMRDALVKLGMDQCDTSGEWYPNAELIKVEDRCQAIEHFDPDFFIPEDDEQETVDRILPQLMRQIVSRGLTKCKDRLPRDASGSLCEPFLSAYREIVKKY